MLKSESGDITRTSWRKETRTKCSSERSRTLRFTRVGILPRRRGSLMTLNDISPMCHLYLYIFDYATERTSVDHPLPPRRTFCDSRPRGVVNKVTLRKAIFPRIGSSTDAPLSGTGIVLPCRPQVNVLVDILSFLL